MDLNFFCTGDHGEYFRCTNATLPWRFWDYNWDQNQDLGFSDIQFACE
jgi:hypothetical protein